MTSIAVSLGESRKENRDLLESLREVEATCDSFLPRAHQSDAVLYGALLMIRKIASDALDRHAEKV